MDPPLTDGLASPTRCGVACLPGHSTGIFSISSGLVSMPSCFHQSSALSIIHNGVVSPSLAAIVAVMKKLP